MIGNMPPIDDEPLYYNHNRPGHQPLAEEPSVHDSRTFSPLGDQEPRPLVGKEMSYDGCGVRARLT